MANLPIFGRVNVSI